MKSLTSKLNLKPRTFEGILRTTMQQKQRNILFGIVLIACLIKLGIHFIGNVNYGFHRDELLHLACADHLDWGYMEFPPLIGWIGKSGKVLFGKSLFATRLFPTLSGLAMMLLTVSMVKELGGKLLATVLALASFLGVLAYWRNHTLFQPVVFDQLFWTIGSFLLIRYLNRGKSSLLLWIGLVAGLGLLNKTTMLFWGMGIAIGLLFHRKAVVYKSKEIWLGGLIAFVIFLPNLLWQWQHDFPIFDHLNRLYAAHLEEISPWDFWDSQLWAMNPLNLVIWISALGFLLFRSKWKTYRPVAIAFLSSGLLMYFFKAKGYYFFAAYPPLIAAGSVVLTEWLQGKWNQNARWAIGIFVVLLLLVSFVQLPYLAPVMPIEKFAEYAELPTNAEGRLEGLTSDYADMFGWEEQVALVDSVYQTLSADEKANCIIWAENYGEAGAVQLLGKKYDLPAPVCKHGSFWMWGSGKASGEIAISLGNEDGAVDYFFEEKTLIKTIKHKYAIDEEHNIPLYLCRKPKVKLSDYWPEFRAIIFE